MAEAGNFSYDKRGFLDLMKRRGISDAPVLQAMASVPREKFVEAEHLAFAYDDSPLPIAEGQTISQPYMVAFMLAALRLVESDRVLEIGTGSGYAAAILSRLVRRVYSVERHRSLASRARQRLSELGYDNVDILCADGTLGWPQHAPFDAIVCAAGAPSIPPSLFSQLALGGRLVIPVGGGPPQRLLRVTRLGEEERTVEELSMVRFVPLLGEEGWEEEGFRKPSVRTRPGPEAKPVERERLSRQIRQAAEPLGSIDDANLDGLLERIGDARLVLLGEATHGSAEFYEMRARISRELILRKGFDFIAVEADWPDASQIDHFLRDSRAMPTPEQTFCRFPEWMWVNRQVWDFLSWLRRVNNERPKAGRVGFFGLDLYSLYASIDAVISYLEGVSEEEAKLARQRYACFNVGERDPARYGRMAMSATHRNCEEEVVRMLARLAREQFTAMRSDGRDWLDAVANARLIKNAERYYRAMYQVDESTWNLRDRHMVEILNALLDYHGERSKAIVWAHNSHLGDAAATEMSSRGEINVGSLCREQFGDQAYLVGFGTGRGTVAAASEWGGPMEIKRIRSPHEESYEHLCHETGLDAFLLPLRTSDAALRKALRAPRLERAIGVIYRPETERASHYFMASLAQQFDEYVWFDETRAVDALGPQHAAGLPESFPFGLG